MFPLGGPARVLACATSRFGGRAFLGLFCASSCGLMRRLRGSLAGPAPLCGGPRFSCGPAWCRASLWVFTYLSRVAPRVLGAVALLFSLLLYEAPGGNQVDGLPPV